MASDGSVDQTKGKVKKAAGELTDDDSLKNEGRVDKATGDIKEKVGEAADKLKNALRRD
ncbi:CsbD family protein [Conexibacter sp. JD483]|uniref:CsbD family protein n=1 Tax=unclassified Conexibacter TaxID=2627773 RepID=UPI00271C346F|nr:MULTISPECIES: CsbD family protein [unclassified Conexibacter]MDO8186190.1 CsbD family protein [Conexibacter sp. CPCC 205706]MDO8199743.1 CsbD family protein [Conexibacter sp. CPCC 205762]MDR9368165.1 CsbD family protein [Conexibacter sp. JD483]